MLNCTFTRKTLFFIVSIRVVIFSFFTSQVPAELYSIFKNGKRTKIAYRSVRETLIIVLAGGKRDSRSCLY